MGQNADKGKAKAREPEQLAPPNGNFQSGSTGLSGNIGSANPNAPSRDTVGGLRVETRCGFLFKLSRVLKYLRSHRFSSIDTLDEPVTTTLVCSPLVPWP